jgi:hypothetical protein
MRTKTTVAILVVGVSVVLFMAFRATNRADAATSDCFSAAAGPSQPTICN